MGIRGLGSNQIDSVRGIACILLVGYHVIGSTTNNGMQVSEESWVRDFNIWLSYVRMPLFTFLSGVVYAARPVERGDIIPFMKGKVVRLLLPLLCVSLLFMVFQTITPGTNTKPLPHEFLQLFIYPYAHFWFLQALFCIFAVVALMEQAGVLATYKKSAIVFLFVCSLFFFRNDFPDLFSLNRAVYLFPFFLSGLILVRFFASFHRTSSALSISAVLIAACLFIFPSLVASPLAQPVLTLVLGITSAVIITAITPSLRILAWVGFYSYSIYLYHVFGTAGARILISYGAPEQKLLIFFASLFAGLIFPIMVHQVLHRIPYLSRLLLGVRPNARPAPRLLQKGLKEPIRT